jgi:hypothetical protein
VFLSHGGQLHGGVLIMIETVVFGVAAYSSTLLQGLQLDEGTQMKKKSDDKFYIMASTNAHIGEALETISQPKHEWETGMPVASYTKALISKFVLISTNMVSALFKTIRRMSNLKP